MGIDSVLTPWGMHSYHVHIKLYATPTAPCTPTAISTQTSHIQSPKLQHLHPKNNFHSHFPTRFPTLTSSSKPPSTILSASSRASILQHKKCEPRIHQKTPFSAGRGVLRSSKDMVSQGIAMWVCNSARYRPIHLGQPTSINRAFAKSGDDAF
jgi:hypothetical protein